ncbi:MAG: putative sulfate exporter family transporter [Vicinamibacterales bacterium]
MLLVGLLLLAFRELLPVDLLSAWSERVVGVALIAVGAWGLWRARTAPAPHRLPAVPSFAMGTLHGLAGSSHLYGVLPSLMFASRADSAAYLGGFGAGAIGAMTAFTALIGTVALAAGRSHAAVRRVVLYAASTAAVIVGGVWPAGPERRPGRRQAIESPGDLTRLVRARRAGRPGGDARRLRAGGRARPGHAGGARPHGRQSVSGVPVAIVLGLLLRNVLPLPAALGPGLRLCTSTVLRLGIVLVGIKLSVVEMARLGAAGVPVVLAAIVTGLVFVTWFNRKLQLPPRLGTLIAAGTSICGVTAIVSTAPAIDADEREVAYAVANVVAFGLVGMLVYPYLAHALLPGSAAIGLFLGTAVHDTSQVVGAALTYRQIYADDAVLRVATVTKLTRNLFLAAVIPLLTWMHARERRGTGSAPATNWRALVPTFVLGFVAMAMLRSLGDSMLGGSGKALGLWDRAAWSGLTSLIGDTVGARWLLGTAMAAVGLNTSFAVFRGVGLKPFAVGMAGALVVGTAGFVMAVLLGRFVVL